MLDIQPDEARAVLSRTAGSGGGEQPAGTTPHAGPGELWTGWKNRNRGALHAELPGTDPGGLLSGCRPYEPITVSKRERIRSTWNRKTAGVHPADIRQMIRTGILSALIFMGTDIAVVSKTLGHKFIAITSDIGGSVARKVRGYLAGRKSA